MVYKQSHGTKTPCWDTNDLVVQEKQTDHNCFSLFVIKCRAVIKGGGLRFPPATFVQKLMKY